MTIPSGNQPFQQPRIGRDGIETQPIQASPVSAQDRIYGVILQALIEMDGVDGSHDGVFHRDALINVIRAQNPSNPLIATLQSAPAAFTLNNEQIVQAVGALVRQADTNRDGQLDDREMGSISIIPTLQTLIRGAAPAR